MTAVTGGCFCGAVKYEFDLPTRCAPARLRHVHRRGRYRVSECVGEGDLTARVVSVSMQCCSFVGHCHCSMCRRISSAAYVSWVGVNKDQVRVRAHTRLRRAQTPCTRSTPRRTATADHAKPAARRFSATMTPSIQNSMTSPLQVCTTRASSTGNRPSIGTRRCSVLHRSAVFGTTPCEYLCVLRAPLTPT